MNRIAVPMARHWLDVVMFFPEKEQGPSEKESGASMLESSATRKVEPSANAL
jgi:hypothetical protein